MGKAYFISDVHLGLESRDREKAKEDRLLNFLDHVQIDASYLFIVGDLFDAWFEYRTVIPKGFHRLFTKLEDLTRKGVAIYYLAGNHDYWIRNFFSDELGMKTFHDAFDIMVNGKKIFIHHGDGLAQNDTGYRLLKIILRNRLSIWLYSWLHPDIGVALAKSSSKKSRNYTQTKDYGDSDGMMQFAKQKIDEGYDIVIMGHRHKPTSEKIGRGTYINLGDWITHNTYAEMADEEITLRYWK